MTGEIGLFCLILATLASLAQAVWGVGNSRRFAPALPMAALLTCLTVTLAFALLITARLDSDFTIANVAEHSNLALATLYKITGAWGNHEGSMLLWAWIMSLYGLGLAMQRPHALTAPTLGVQGVVASCMLLFIIFTSNPFARIFPPPPDGNALNPLLQDVALAIHPPLLYGGYVGFGAVFALAVAALLRGELPGNWARLARPWLLVSWSCLTLGIGLGSWWAYRELGWGGWWFWDPVENASLLPWLAGTALLHANVVLEKRGMLKSWVLLLAIVTFSLSLLGTFLVRSGVLTSVHTFASDPARGAFILAMLCLLSGGALLIYALQLKKIVPEHEEKPLPMSREGMIVVNNMLLLVACATVALGTLYPLFAEWTTGTKLSVGAPYFNMTFLPLMSLPVLFAGIALLTPWQSANLRHLARRLRGPLLASLGAAAIALAVTEQKAMLAAAGFGLAAFLLLATLRAKPTRRGLGAMLAHGGMALLVAGITGHALYAQEHNAAAADGARFEFAGLAWEYAGETALETPNYLGRQGLLRAATQAGDERAVLRPELRRYRPGGMTTGEASIDFHPFYDLYAVLGESGKDGPAMLRVYYNPLISLIWLGVLAMTAGGLAALLALMGKKRQ